MKNELKLSDIPKRNPYQVPDGYFDRLPARVMERTESAQEQAFWLESLWRPLRLAVAPLVLLLVFVAAFFYSVPDKPIINLAGVPDTAIVDYLSTYATLETADFAELHNLQEQELPSEMLNVSPKAAEEELEYYDLNHMEY
ncbi:hypothetical protein [Pontibacter mangrovi]|uniref:Uncharacterized protein n=1 Tax=Pontibacter mangrovi TaxID=2589816 RepID=A0A501W7J9_9BACT|nr:hypothetical protein [Pontibacter mangrovi]TPE44310.1 hypothetical protein FJM65_09155 [Pontibacter mangrovi]